MIAGEQHADFIAYQSKRRTRQEASLAVAARKRTELMAETEKVAVPVLEMPYADMREAAFRHYEKRRRKPRGYCAGADWPTQVRWMLNYLRHVLSHYEQQLKPLKGRVGKQEAYRLIRRKVTLDSYRAYPELREAHPPNVEVAYGVSPAPTSRRRRKRSPDRLKRQEQSAPTPPPASPSPLRGPQRKRRQRASAQRS